MVAEDDFATRALLRATLGRASYHVREVDNGAAALAEILSCPPDVAQYGSLVGVPIATGEGSARS